MSTTPRPGLALPVRLGCGLLMLILAGLGAFALTRLKKEAPRDEQPIPIEQVEVLVLERSDLSSPLVSYGLVLAGRRIELAAEVAGRADSVHAGLKRGLWIEQGELIAAIDSRRQRIELERLRAQLDRASALLARSRLERYQLGDGIRIAEKLYLLERDQLARAETLFATGKTSDNEVKRLQKTSLQSEDSLRRLRDSQALIGPQLAQLKADSAALGAQLADARIQLEQCEIRAPVSGVIREVALEQFQQLAAGRMLLAIDDVETLELEVPLTLADASLFNLPAHDGSVVEPAEATVLLDLGDGREEAWRGRLVRLQPIDPETQTRKAVIHVAERLGQREQMLLEPGMFCRIELSSPPQRNVLAVPRHLLRSDGRLPLVVDGRLELRPVKLGRSFGDWSVIVEGVEAGVQVLRSRLPIMVPGMPLEVVAQP